MVIIRGQIMEQIGVIKVIIKMEMEVIIKVRELIMRELMMREVEIEVIVRIKLV